MLMYRLRWEFAVSWAILVLCTVMIAAAISFMNGSSPPLLEYVRNAALLWGGVVILIGLVLSIADAGNL
jgi:hypothetical protein